MRKFLAAFLMAILALAGTTPVPAADAPGYGVTVGGRIRSDMGWQFLGEHNRFGNNSDSSIANFFATVNTDSYLRATFSSADKNTGAHIELGLGGFTNRDNAGNAADNPVSLRIAYGWWKVASCRLLVGQFPGRLGDRILPGNNLGNGKSGKSDLKGFGFIGGTRNPKVALQMDVNDNFSFELALGQAGAEVSSFGMYPGPVTGVSSTDSYLPRLELVLDFNFDNFLIAPSAGISYQKATLGDAFSAVDDNTLSYIFILPLKYQNGPFSLVFNAFYGQNTDTDWNGENGTSWATPPGGGGRFYGGQPGVLPVLSGNQVEDTKYWGLGLGLAYNFTDTLGVKVGGGLANISNDAWELAGVDSNDSYTRWGAFISFPYKVSANFTISPELAYFDYGSRVGVNLAGIDDDAGHEVLAGVHFQFLF
ncbi:MAG: hypothetical protein LBJ14_06825 [Desulfarculales bacterium]|nr:hypothetical protein [Desulfarculales bacterium]